MHCEETIRSDNLCFQEIVLEMQVLPDAALGFTEKKKKRRNMVIISLCPHLLIIILNSS